MQPVRLGDRIIAPGEGLKAFTRERDMGLEKQFNSREKFQADTCQSCGARERPNEACVCDGLDWYMLPGGGVECQAHRFARAIGGTKKFWFFKR